MQHLILTRLAIGKPSQEWLAERLSLFRNFCAPSLEAQTWKNFTWLLAVSATTPQWFIRAIQRIAPTARITTQVSDDPLSFDWNKALRNIIREGILVTTRLDSDDMLCNWFVETIQNIAKNVAFDFIIDFPQGYQLRTSDLICSELNHLASRSYKPTHFLTLVETLDRSRQAKFAYFRNHRDMNKFWFPLVVKGPAWVETCHGNNLVNAFRAECTPANWDIVKKSFT